LSNGVAFSDDCGELHVSVEHCLSFSGEQISSAGSSKLVFFLTRLRKVSRGLNLFLHWPGTTAISVPVGEFISTGAEIFESFI
jgi:hypothetical protein